MKVVPPQGYLAVSKAWVELLQSERRPGPAAQALAMVIFLEANGFHRAAVWWTLELLSERSGQSRSRVNAGLNELRLLGVVHTARRQGGLTVTVLRPFLVILAEGPKTNHLMAQNRTTRWFENEPPHGSKMNHTERNDLKKSFEEHHHQDPCLTHPQPALGEEPDDDASFEPNAQGTPPSDVPGLTPDQQALVERLVSEVRGFDPGRARMHVLERPRELIETELRYLPLRPGVKNPAAFLDHALRSGGFPPPPKVLEAQNRAASELRKRDAQQREQQELAFQQRLAEDRIASQLAEFRARPQAEQDRLLEQVRRDLGPLLRRHTGPIPLDEPGPFRGRLLELLEQERPLPRAAGPTPRVGAFARGSAGGHEATQATA